jgi:hypothetical protein
MSTATPAIPVSPYLAAERSDDQAQRWSDRRLARVAGVLDVVAAVKTGAALGD